MPGILGIIGRPTGIADRGKLLETIDSLLLCHTKVINTTCGLMACSWLKTPTLSSYHYEDSNHVACFAGDIIDLKKIPWKTIIDNLERGKIKKYFSELKGTYCFAILRKRDKRIWVISDRTSQQPIYYLNQDNSLIYSTSLSTFCRLQNSPGFNKKWLYEFLFFNYPIGETTFLKNVKRLPPASVLEYDFNNSKHELKQYADFFKRSKNLFKGEEALERAFSVFSDRIPKYFGKENQCAIALTKGFDSRTVLSLAPETVMNSLTTYTYGIPNCSDLIEASKVASTLKLPHIGIRFEEDFTNNLKQLMYRTIYLSNGMERVTRSTLLYVYDKLTVGGKSFPIVVTGVSGDHLFRDHIRGRGNVPAIISPDMMQVFSKGRMRISRKFYKKILRNTYKKFEEYIYHTINDLNHKYGELNDPKAYILFLIYEIAPKYFSGEASIARNFTNFRTPYWDNDIIQLSLDVEYSTLGFSELFKKRDLHRECRLQTFIIGRNREFGKIQINGLPLTTYSIGNKLVKNLSRIKWKGPKKLKSLLKPVSCPPMEDWGNWFDSILKDEINHIINRESIISNYVSQGFLEEIKKEGHTHWMGKILTAEILLNLVENGWKVSRR